MYRITYVHKNESTENPLYIAGDADYCLITATLDLECGKSGELVVSLPDINPAKEDILCLTDEVIIYRDSEEIWRGRPVTLQMDFDRTGTLTCEGILSYLYDTAFPPFEFEGSPKEFLQMVLDNHNSQVETRKQFTLGDVTVEDNNDYINRSSIYYDKSLNVLVEKLIEDTLGGYFRVRIENGTRYLDYVSTYNTEATQMVRFGENILDIAEEIEYSDLATVILPLGAKLKDDEGMDTDEYLTIASVNGGSYYYADEAAVDTYGWIVVIAEWSDVTVPDNLLTKAKDYLAQVTSALSSFTVNAIDLSLISDEEPIRLGDYVWIRSDPHGINQYIELTEQHIDILYPENDVLSFGVDTATLTGSQKSTDRAVQSALGSINMRVTNMSADVINAVYANIETIVANTVNADYIYSLVAELGYLTADEIEARFVSIDNLQADIANLGYLTADSAIITDLTAFAENVYVLLGGTGSFGELETIHLTSDNAVIDEAVIVTALMDTVLASVLTAGVIYTDYIQIANNEGKQLWIDGSTIQLTDNNEIVRVQIGEDGTGDYNLYLWNADGELIWDAQGLCEAGLPVGDDAIIKDAAVADDANISGYKLNIDEICTIINTDGSYQIDAASVTINGETLDAWYVTVQDWGDTTVILQTQLTEIQGLIDAKVWETDIQDALDPIYGDISSLTDSYAEIRVEVDNISSEVASVTTTEAEHYIEMSSQITEINETIDGITTQVSSVTESIEQLGTSIDDIESQLANQEGLKQLIPYFCIWDSGTESPPDNEDLTPAICGEAICGLTICGVTDGLLWTTVEPVPDEDQFKWIKWLQVFEDGTETWSTAYCLTDIYARSAIVSNYETLYTLIEQNNDSVNITISQALGTIYETQDGIISTLDAYNTYFSFDIDGLHISKSNSPFAVVLGTEKLSFTENDSEIAYISNSMLYIHDAEVITSLKIGGFRWEIGTTGNLNLVKVSEKDYDDNEEPDHDEPDNGGDEG